MPANGPLVHPAKKKYGPRVDQRKFGRKKLFTKLQKIIHPESEVTSDENPHYPKDIKKFFSAAKHKAVKGRRGAITGQGELKMIGFDPLFSLNHTCAMFRANVNRLIRKTWCTTKKRENLVYHLAIYAEFHNETIAQRLVKAAQA